MVAWYKSMLVQLAVITICAALLGSNMLLIRASEKDSTIPYNPLTVTFLIEAVKLFASLIALFSIKFFEISTTETTLTCRESLVYAPPALLYMIDNNFSFYILLYMEPATLSIMWNIKIFTTALMFQFFLKRQLSKLKWIAIVLLLVGVVTSSSNKHLLDTDENKEEASLSNFTIGMILVLVGVNISSAAGIYSEWAMKRRVHDSIFLQNVHFYMYGVLINGIAVVWTSEETTGEKSFFDGYNVYTIGVVISGSMTGLFVGLLFKFLDNIVVAYAHTLSMLFTTLASMYFFGFDFTLEFGCGLVVCLISLYLYNMEDDNQLVEKDQDAVKAHHEVELLLIDEDLQDT